MKTKIRRRQTDRKKVRAPANSRRKYSSKLTSKCQATVPKEIREHLHLEKGDQIIYELLPDETVVIRKTSPLDLEYLKALTSTLKDEWDSEEDDRAYKNL